jgi:hypothetical protein
MLMRLVSIFQILFLCLIYGNIEAKEIVGYKNLQGIDRINERITFDIHVTGDEPFDIDETKLIDIIKSNLKKSAIEIDNTNNANANIAVELNGETTGGGGARIAGELILYSQVASPFDDNIKIPAIIWRTKIFHEQVMAYNPKIKKLSKVEGPINERVYRSVNEAMAVFQKEYKMARQQKR